MAEIVIFLTKLENLKKAADLTIQWTRAKGAARVDLELPTDEGNHYHGHRNSETPD